ncbi:peptidoglycan-binding domain-containing protein [Streptomyces cavernae]|uniref:peptidoglycan-binding domain-containing protein n=1 Tax=Streptomyces cavernae TaxID=2259034 RepID=UPI001390BEE2|nr:peptidoglycan-binding domain-containing protein [Streptomyces cavernae]
MSRSHSVRVALSTLTAAVLGWSGLAIAAAGPAAAYDGWCNSYVSRTKTISGSTYTAYIPSYNSSTNCYMNSGAQSQAVAMLQRSLNVCYSESLVVDGSFGRNTTAALTRAQRKEGIGADGEYGTQSRDHLKWEFSRGGAFSCRRL